MNRIQAWYLHGIASNDLPGTLDALRQRAAGSDFAPETLLQTSKWDFLIKEGAAKHRPGFLPLRNFASTKRGIATGANEFFHLTAPAAGGLALPAHILVPCMGRANDVAGFEFSCGDFDTLRANGRRVYLATFGCMLSAAELRYIASAEASGIHKRYLLAARKPWYAMETQQPAPIWAAVFGRRGLRFVHNRTGALTLTTFHCVYPFDAAERTVAALTLCLNAPSIQAAARAHTRVYGGGLLKFEPRDLLEIQVPDLRNVAPKTVVALATEQARIVDQLRGGADYDTIDWLRAEQLITAAAQEASMGQAQTEPSEKHRSQASHRRQLDGHKAS